MADFLAGGAAAGGLARFPYFYESPVDLVFSEDPNLGPDAFDEIIALQGAFRGLGLSLALVDEPAEDHDTLTLGLYNRADDVADLLAAAGIELVITPAIPTTTDAAPPANAVRAIRSD